jgi:hypothetical protein
MQRQLYFRLMSPLVLLAGLFGALPSKAQYAYNYVAKPVDASVAADPEEGKSTTKTAYKLVHGVIQGEQGVLPGATVWLQGSKTIVVANEEGAFELSVPADAKEIKLACGYGGLQEEVVTLAPVQALGSVYLRHVKAPAKRLSALQK